MDNPNAFTITTVNIIEIDDTMTMSVTQLVSFPDNELGNERAEELFGDLMKKHDSDMVDEDVEDALDSGYYKDDTYYLCIVHSTPVETE
jgi:hypothetical protein